jgi:hypothetical protein
MILLQVLEICVPGLTHFGEMLWGGQGEPIANTSSVTGEITGEKPPTGHGNMETAILLV